MLVLAIGSATAAMAINRPQEETPYVATEQQGHIDQAGIIRLARIDVARSQACKDPEGTVDAIGDSPIADLLLSTAIEESKCNKDAVGDAGEEGAWQVIAADWGPVPKDLPGQARQAERIILRLANAKKGDYAKAMSHYNGGLLPKQQSLDYASRVLLRRDLIALRISKGVQDVSW